MKKKIFQVAALAFLLAVTACGEKKQTQQVAEYAGFTVTASDVEVESLYSATIRGRQDIQIMPQVGGTISQLCVNEGESVRKGQTLFIIDQVPYRAALTTAEANVKAAEAGVATAQLTYDSKKELYTREVVSEYDLRLAENQLLTAKAALAQAKAQEVNARNSLSYTVVKAPANGVVGTIPFRVGALVGPSMPQPLTTVSDNSEMYVYFSMNENQLLRLTRRFGSMERMLELIPALQLKLSDGTLYNQEGRLESVSGVIDPSTGAISLRAVFPNPDRLLRSGSTGNILLTQEEKGALLIPCSATFEVQDKIFVYTVEEGLASSKMVEVTKYDGLNYIVKSGLQAGDQIVAEGVGMLREGTPIQIKEEGSEQSPATENQVTEE